MTLELNVSNICKQPCDIENEDNKNEEIKFIKSIIKEHIQDEISTNSVEICFTSSFKSSKKLECNIASICSILDSMHVSKDDSS